MSIDERREKYGTERGAAAPTEELQLVEQNCDRYIIGLTVTGDIIRSVACMKTDRCSTSEVVA